MKVIIISRHEATINYLKNYFDDDVIVEVVNKIEEVDLMNLPPSRYWDEEEEKECLGTFFVGNLPNRHVATLYNRGFNFFTVEFESLPPRGVELTPEDLKKYGIELVHYSVKRTGKSIPRSSDPTKISMVQWEDV